MQDSLRQGASGDQASAVSDAQAGPLRILVVSDGVPLRPELALPESQEISFLSIQDLTPEALSLSAFDVILAPLVGRAFDGYDLAARLMASGFAGRLRIAADDLPDPGLVRRELRSAFPRLDIDIVDLRAAREPPAA